MSEEVAASAADLALVARLTEERDRARAELEALRAAQANIRVLHRAAEQMIVELIAWQHAFGKPGTVAHKRVDLIVRDVAELIRQTSPGVPLSNPDYAPTPDADF